MPRPGIPRHGRRLGGLAHCREEVHNNVILAPLGPQSLPLGSLVWTTCHRRGRHDDEASYVQRNRVRWSAARVVGSSVPGVGGAVGRHYGQGHRERRRGPGRRGGDDSGAGRCHHHGDLRHLHAHPPRRADQRPDRHAARALRRLQARDAADHAEARLADRGFPAAVRRDAARGSRRDGRGGGDGAEKPHVRRRQGGCKPAEPGARRFGAGLTRGEVGGRAGDPGQRGARQ